MKREDRFDYFLKLAITSPNESPEYIYFYDEKNKSLVRIPVGFSSSKGDSYVELPKLSFQEKKAFLVNFFDNQPEQLRTKAFAILDNFRESSDFKLDHDIKEIDKDLALSFFFESGKFLYGKVKELYGDFSLDEKMNIEWN